MKEVFVDSSAFFAWADVSSPEGKAIASFIVDQKPSLVTTNLIIAETLSLVTKRVGKYAGIRLGESLMASKMIRVIYSDVKIQREGWQLYKEYKDKDFDLIDAISFVVCQKWKIQEVLTLDQHFTQMKFKPVSLQNVYGHHTLSK